MVEFLGLMEGSVVGQREATGSVFTFEMTRSVGMWREVWVFLAPTWPVVDAS